MQLMDAMLAAGAESPNVSEWCQVNGVDRRTFYRHRPRARAEGQWRPRSRRPHTIPHATPEPVVAEILRLRQVMAPTTETPSPGDTGTTRPTGFALTVIAAKARLIHSSPLPPTHLRQGRTPPPDPQPAQYPARTPGNAGLLPHRLHHPPPSAAHHTKPGTTPRHTEPSRPNESQHPRQTRRIHRDTMGTLPPPFSSVRRAVSGRRPVTP